MSGRARSLFALLAVLSAALCGCPEDDAAPPLPPPTWELDEQGAPRVAPLEGEPAPHAVLAVVADDREDLLACACPDGVVGGYARRASLLTALRSEIGDLLAVAGPGSLAPPEDQGVPAGETLARARRLLDIHAEVGMEVVALGGPDAAIIPADQLALLAGETSVPLLATNLRCSGGGCSSVRRVWVHESPGGPVAILALTDPGAGPLEKAGYEVLDPVAAAAEAVASLETAPAAVVALCDHGPRALDALAKGIEGVDFLLGSNRMGGQVGVQAGSGAFRVLLEPGSLRVGLLDLVFTGAAGAGFVDAPRLRDLSEQRLASYGRRARLELSGSSPHLVDGEGEGGADRVELLGRQLTLGAADGHAFGFKEAPVLKIYPEREGVTEAVDAFREASGANIL